MIFDQTSHFSGSLPSAPRTRTGALATHAHTHTHTRDRPRAHAPTASGTQPRRRIRRISIVALACIAFFSVFFLRDVGRAEAAPLKVRVRGTAKLTAHASREQQPTLGLSDLVLSGSLSDDAGQPLSLQKVNVRVTRETDPHDERVVEALKAPRGCDSARVTTWGIQPGGANEVVVTTDEDGRFCFRVRLEPDRYKANLVYTSSGMQSLVDGIERELTFDLSRRSLALRFDPTPRVVQLDTPQTMIEAVAIVDDDGNPHVARGLNLVLANEKEELARAVSDSSGRARFAVAGAKLGSPGPGELRVSFAGDGDTAGASHAEEIERHVKVAVKVPAADRGELTASVPEDGIPLVAEVGSSFGPLTEGSIEARIGEVVVGTAPVERGIARLVLTFASQGTEALVRLRYVPASPWYEPLGEATIRLPIRAPSLLSKAPILVAGLVVMAFFLVGRVSGQKNKPEPEPAKGTGKAAEAKARIDLVRRAERGQEGWTGRVVDAHEGTPVPGARVWIERGTFEGRSVLASVESDADGRFTLPGIGTIAGDESIVVEARLHARLAQDLPASGEMVIAIEQRRRAILAALVRWARRRGPPFDTRPEPTPGHVRRVASGELATARWADAVERAAFGPDEIDAGVEQDIARLAPEERPGPDPVPNDGRRDPRNQR